MSWAAVLAVPSLRAASMTPEAALGALLSRHASQLGADDAAGAAESCRLVLDSGALGRFAPVAESLLGADLLALGHAEEGAKRLERLLVPNSANADAIVRLADIQARRWLSRLDREEVVAALKAYYAANVRYPDTLEPLRSLRPPPPLRDRWGEPWNYRLANFRALKGVSAQRYTLESRNTGRLSDLAKALQARATSPGPEGWRVSRSREAGAILVETAEGRNSIVREGDLHAGFRFAGFAGRSALFSSGDAWFLLPLAPGGTP